MTRTERDKAQVQENLECLSGTGTLIDAPIARAINATNELERIDAVKHFLYELRELRLVAEHTLRLMGQDTE